MAAEEGQKNDLDLYFPLLLGVNNEDQQCAITERKAARPPWQCCTFAWIHNSPMLHYCSRHRFLKVWGGTIVTSTNPPHQLLFGLMTFG